MEKPPSDIKIIRPPAADELEKKKQQEIIDTLESALKQTSLPEVRIVAARNKIYQGYPALSEDRKAVIIEPSHTDADTEVLLVAHIISVKIL